MSSGILSLSVSSGGVEVTCFGKFESHFESFKTSCGLVSKEVSFKYVLFVWFTEILMLLLTAFLIVSFVERVWVSFSDSVLVRFSDLSIVIWALDFDVSLRVD